MDLISGVFFWSFLWVILECSKEFCVGFSGMFFRSFLWILLKFYIDLSGMFYKEFGVGLSV